MRSVFLIVSAIILTNFYSCRATTQSERGLPGNNIVEFVQHKKGTRFFTDPIDDTTHFKKVADNIYKDKRGNVYILNVCFEPISKDTSVYLEYFKNVTDFIDVKSYRQIKYGYFQNKGKVYMWWANSDGGYPIEVEGADPNTFVPFDSVAGGKDKQYVFCDGAPGNFKIIQGADPESIKVLNTERGCWNCNNCYFVDDKMFIMG